MKLKRLTLEDFDQLANRTEMGTVARQLARSVLVDGRPQIDVAKAAGFDRQRVTLALKVIEREYFKSTDGGNGLVSIELELPDPLAVALVRLTERLKHCPSKRLRATVLTNTLQFLDDAARQLD